MLSKDWYVKYLSIPFQFDCSSMVSCDCAGLVFLVLEQELGLTLERTDEVKCDARQKHVLMRKYFDIVTEIPRSQILPLDIFFITGAGPWHTGVVVNKDKILESTSDRGCMIKDIKLVPSHATFYRVKDEYKNKSNII